jgi:hypothetical protein
MPPGSTKFDTDSQYIILNKVQTGRNVKPVKYISELLALNINLISIICKRSKKTIHLLQPKGYTATAIRYSTMTCQDLHTE